ncbi:hypothetical protein [Oscillibacter sp.]|uniref:hypothetical protein n=1 Tax=Oscillibacter sp. TaxID=1945593 RepID=UPI002D80026B|nr:hypothetical protein [Oscillibacter sp.]
MRLQGCDSVFMNRAGGSSPPRDRSAGTGFLDRLKSAASAAAPEQAADVLALTKTDEGLRDLLYKLTPASRDVLDRMEAGKKDISPDEWTALCKELKTLGAISKEDFQYTQAGIRVIPLGYWGEDGEFVRYDTVSIMKNKLPDVRHSQSGQWICPDEYDWKGDPLAYLDNWMKSLYSWRSDMARARNEDGSPKYSDFSPITSQINACQRVTDLVKALWKCGEGAGL